MYSLKHFNRRKLTLLIVSGVLLISVSSILVYYNQISDFYRGALMGGGFGLLLLAIAGLKKLEKSKMKI